METPKLIDNNVRFFLLNSLKKCHDYRVEMYSVALNVGVFVFLVLIFGITLFYCYKKPLSQYEKERKMQKEQDFILSKIRYFQQIKQHQLENYSSLPFN